MNIEGISSGQIKILVVEDDSTTRMLIEAILKSLGKSAVFAVDGQDGLEKFEEHSPELVITDYNMPKMNGLEMLEAIKVKAPAAKLVLMTIYTESEVLIEAINLGVDRFIEKPLFRDKVQDVLDVLFEDILTAQNLKKHQNLLKAYRVGVDTSTIFSILDSAGNFSYVNELFLSLSGYDEDELVGKHYSTTRNQRVSTERIFTSPYKKNDEVIWHGWHENIAKSGHKYVTESTLIPVYEDKMINSYISIEKDMTIVISQYKEHLQAFFDADSSILIALDEDMKLAMCNREFLRFFSFEDISHACENNFSLCNYLSDDNEYIASCAKGGDSALIRNILTDDSVMKVSVSRGIDESELSYFVISRFELDQSFFGLDNLIIVRLSNITELERLKKEELSSAALASIGKLAAGITHEINTPLTYIKGNIELLSWDLEEQINSNSEMADYFNSVNEGVARISSIIESMKEVTGEADFVKRKVNLFSTFVIAGRMVYNRSKHISTIYLNGAKLDMQLDPEDEIYMVSAAPQMLEQVWIILLNNSLDQLSSNGMHHEDRYIKIDIQETDPGGYRILISDNGGGIEKSVIGKIFDPFSSTKKHKGMGLGLNIAKNIIDKHKGSIRPFNSDEGAVFEILL